ncbi:uncharacterized protein [Chelonus insularis]|uniref:uncharacterized protein n=1 Tax=Chelonus insularis TaxID=460826 RepID=UPI0015888D68|nr:uncharacterized protein LOC118066270 [Chelonus insularis]XP_034938082.1 uncharacterized protein LOC118066270 [Chelonus insularis]
MTTVQVGFFIAISIIFCLTSVTYCHPNESRINEHQSQKLSRLLKRETLSDVYHSLEAFENDEESLPDNFQTSAKRSISCKSDSIEKPKKEEKKPEVKVTSSNKNDCQVGTTHSPELTLSPQVVSIDTTPNKTCIVDIFRDTDSFFKNVNNNLRSLTDELSKVYRDLANKTLELQALTQITNPTFLDTNNGKSATDISALGENITEMKKSFTQMIPTITSITGILAPLKTPDSVTTKISTCVENIKNNVTEFATKMRVRIDGANNYFNNFLNQIKNAVNPLRNFNVTILDRVKEKLNINSETKNQTLVIERLIKQNAALGVLGQFLSQFTKAISGFFHVISRKWSHENKHPHHHGLVGSIKHVFGWPSHVHPEPKFFHRIFSLPNLHSKHHDEHISLLKKILKIPDHHHHHPGSIIKHLLNSLYSIFHLSDHCECPQDSKSTTSCPVSHFFNWLGKPTPHHHYHHKHAPGHINLHHNVVKHKQPACSCS